VPRPFRGPHPAQRAGDRSRSVRTTAPFATFSLTNLVSSSAARPGTRRSRTLPAYIARLRGSPLARPLRPSAVRSSPSRRRRTSTAPTTVALWWTPRPSPRVRPPTSASSISTGYCPPTCRDRVAPLPRRLGRHEVRAPEPDRQRRVAGLHDSARRERHVGLTASTPENDRRPLREAVRLTDRPPFRACESARPAQLLQVACTGGVVGKTRWNSGRVVGKPRGSMPPR
jgi:hypothetical protein